MLFEQANKCIKEYEHSWGSRGHKRQTGKMSRVQYQRSQYDLTGVRGTPETRCIRVHTASGYRPTTQSTGVIDDITTHSTDTSAKPTRHPVLGFPIVHLSSIIQDPPYLPTFPANSERCTSNGRGHFSFQSDLCRKGFYPNIIRNKEICGLMLCMWLRENKSSE